MADTTFSLSPEAKKEYLDSLIGKVYKILHLIEEEKVNGYSPRTFIYGQILEVNAANVLYNGKLVNIIVKLKVIYDNYDKVPFTECKKQVFEIKKMINGLLKNLAKDEEI